MTESILISTIAFTDRMRQELGDLSDLKESLEEHGLLQAVGVRREADLSYRLIWGGRRVEAARQLGWTEVDANILECTEDYELREKELEENIRRKDMTWQEQACSMHEIHRLKTNTKALIGERWGYRDTGRLLGVSVGNVQYTLEVAGLLRSGDEEVKKASNMTEALRVLMRRKEAELQKKKLTLNKKVDQDSFFNADALKSMEKQSNLKLDSTYDQTLTVSPTIPYGTKLIIAHTPTEADIKHVAASKDCLLLFRVDLSAGESIEALHQVNATLGMSSVTPVVFRDESINEELFPFKNSNIVFALCWSDEKKSFHSKNNVPAYVGNAFVERKQYGPYAVASQFWAIIFNTLVPSHSPVFFSNPRSSEGILSALQRKMNTFVSDTNTLDGLVEAYQPNGSLTIK